MALLRGGSHIPLPPGWDDEDQQLLLVQLQDTLDSESLHTRRSPKSLRFHVPAFRWRTGWDAFVPVQGGEVTVEGLSDKRHLAFKLTFDRFAFTVLILVGAVIGPAVLDTPSLSVVGRIGLLAAAVGLIVGPNILLATHRFEELLASIIIRLKSPNGRFNRRRQLDD